MDKVDCAIIGAGVIGLACARALGQSGREVVILEAENAFGTHTSSRNSEVIHAGIYYPPGSFKAKLCVEGRQLLYRYCEDHGVEHRRCGKLIVATQEAQRASLDLLLAQAKANSVTDLQWLTAGAVHELEPEIRCVDALLSPSTGIIDSHAYMLSLLGEAEALGATLALKSPFVRGEIRGGEFILEAGGERIAARRVVNSAGLNAQEVCTKLTGFPQRHVPPAFYAKGNYYALARRAPFSHLIYPVPEPGGLGVHLTLDLAGRGRFGPDVEWLDDVVFDYRVDPKRAERFYTEVRTYWPGLPDDSIAPAYSGIRPKLVGPGKGDSDFLIQGPRTHGISGLVNLFGIESPGLTASLAIADAVRAMLER